jgi:hypothetical protein
LAGKIADLASKYPDAEDRELSAAFLEELLTNPSDSELMRRYGVRIGHAIFPDEVDLRGTQALYRLVIDYSQFLKPVILYDASFPSDIHFSGTRFEAEANFGKIRTADDAIFFDTEFMGFVDFSLAQIGGGFRADNAKFLGENGADFERIQVNEFSVFSGTVFTGPVLFRGADFGVQLQAENARFNSVREANFEGIKTWGLADFSGSIFGGPMNLWGAEIGSQFQATNAHFNSDELVNFGRMTTGDRAYFDGAVFNGMVGFIEAEFESVSLIGVTWPDDPDSLAFDRMEYEDITVGGSIRDDFPALLDLLEKARYYPRNYLELEEHYDQLGYPDLADRAFVAQLRRERSENLVWLDWLGNLFLEVFVGYGRYPERAAIWIILVLIMGMWIFRKMGDMVFVGKDEHPVYYNALWYSVDQFLPIDLQMSKHWTPNTSKGWIHHYARVHTMLGWLLIPIALLAWSGLFN